MVFCMAAQADDMGAKGNEVQDTYGMNCNLTISFFWSHPPCSYVYVHLLDTFALISFGVESLTKLEGFACSLEERGSSPQERGGKFPSSFDFQRKKRGREFQQEEETQKLEQEGEAPLFVPLIFILSRYDMPGCIEGVRDAVSKTDLVSAPRSMLGNCSKHRKCGGSNGK